MNITITGKDVVVTQAMREYALNKLERIKRMFGQTIHVIFSFSVDAAAKAKQHRHRVSISVRTGGNNKSDVTGTAVATKKKGVEIFLEQLHEDMYAALDELIDRLADKVSQHKGKTADHQRLAKFTNKRISAHAA